MKHIFSILAYGVAAFFILAVIGYYPALTVAFTAVTIVGLFILGNE